MSDDDQSVEANVRRWFESEGYPLEFRTAMAFERARFHVRQSDHVRCAATGAVREIDVMASTSWIDHPHLLRVYHVVECKWSRDKPWVVFAKQHDGMAPSAAIAQSVASRLGETLYWLAASDASIQAIGPYAESELSGFGGRRAFAKGEDLFYNTLQAVVSNSVATAEEYDDPRYPKQKRIVPFSGVVVFPTIVIDGRLFTAARSKGTSDVDLKEVESAKLHWRGAEARNRLTTVEVVTIDALPSYVERRRVEVDTLMNTLVEQYRMLRRCDEERTLDHLAIGRAARGVTGWPPVLSELRTSIESERRQIAPSSSSPPDTGA